MRRCILLLLALLVLPAAATAQAPAPTESVWTISFIRVKPKMGDLFLDHLNRNWRREMEAAKDAGVILSYRVITADATGPIDWDLMLMTEYPDEAALQTAGAKFRIIREQLGTTQDDLHLVLEERASMRTILATRLGREVVFH